MSLLEDDPEAMVWFCRAFHLKLDANGKGPGFDLCLKLAILCDKYNALLALSGWSHRWIEARYGEAFATDEEY